MRKNNITLGLENIISFSRNIISHFTGKAKIIILVLAIIMLSFVNITLSLSDAFYNSNVSALSYSSNVGVGFTFNPTLSLNISSSDLVISNLTPGTADTSNEISVNISTNSAYGYTLSVGVSNNNLVHSNNTDIFSNIATTANLPSLTTDNTWGYSTSLDNGVSWSNYNGLSSSNNTELISTNYKAQDIMNFKIAARAGNVQPSGTYTNAITFYAVTKPAVITLLDAYKAVYPALEQKNGYYKMQDMTPEICSAVEEIPSDLQVIDIRDDKVYWITKLKDGHCWMTQNLDFDIDSTKTYTHNDTDLGWDANNFDANAFWKPDTTNGKYSLPVNGISVSNWSNKNNYPYSADPGDIYYYTSNSSDSDIKYTSLSACTSAGHTEGECKHYHAGNYYNWTAAIASNDSSNISNDNEAIATNSICPKGWRLPNASQTDNVNNEFGRLLFNSGITAALFNGNDSVGYKNGIIGFNKLRSDPYYLVRSGDISYNTLNGPGISGMYWSDVTSDNTHSYYLYFNSDNIYLARNYFRYYGGSVRCLAR